MSSPMPGNIELAIEALVLVLEEPNMAEHPSFPILRDLCAAVAKRETAYVPPQAPAPPATAPQRTPQPSPLFTEPPSFSPPPSPSPPPPADDGLLEPEEEKPPPAFKDDPAAEALDDGDWNAYQKEVQDGKSRASAAGTSPAEAVEALTSALAAEASLGQLSALTYARRSAALLSCGRVLAAQLDADAALALNGDSALGLRASGAALRARGRYEEAYESLAAAQAIDYSLAAEEMMGEIEGRVREIRGREVKRRNSEADERLRGRKARAQKAAAPPAGDPAGDPLAGLSEAGRAKLAALMAGGAPPSMEVLMGLLSDPELAPIVSKMMGGMDGGEAPRNPFDEAGVGGGCGEECGDECGGGESDESDGSMPDLVD
ncbi:hypothetical protein TeGR_g6610 [Tetraparma gracilis]|uniref:STI1 domain-containing protein n=1 Tax=Tetraparma gracilis TaxID=2962635 RepID=A0ABQ6N054_9STRA|nr:hypothetical protein TeGR_g6610 [Tetraparma gracilis]